MFKKSIPLAIFLLSTFSIWAQVPQNIISEPGDNSLQRMACIDQFAGTITVDEASLVGQSNDVDLDTIYLCFGDQLQLLHNGDEDLTGDPDTNTPPGVGYGFYNCPPTVQGPDKTAIGTDPCLVNNPPPVDLFYVIPGDNLGGDLLLNNDGNLQINFNGGAPALFWFAPITFDAFNGVNAVYEDNGPCVNVNAAAAFAVVYLNEITVDNENNMSNGACEGSFEVFGGLPEFDGGIFSVTVTNSADPAIVGIMTNGSINHGDVARFKVPEPGLYDIVVEDEKGCSHTFQMDMTACPAVTTTAGDATGNNGDVVCVEIIVEDFTDILTMQYTITWDPTVMIFDDIQNFNLNGLEPFVFGTPAFPNVDEGELTLSWSDPDLIFDGETVPSPTTIFEVCFELIGQPGDSSPVNFSNSPTTIDIADINGQPVGTIFNSGTVTIAGGGNFASVTGMNVTCTGTSTGSFSVTATGQMAPYSFVWQEENGMTNGPVVIPVDGDTETVTGLPVGTYYITTTDSGVPPATAMDIDTVIITEPPLLQVGSIPTFPRCFQDSTGMIEVPIAGGTPPYTYLWSTGETTQNLTNVPAGDYMVTVTDANNCTAENTETLFEAPEIIINIAGVDATCSGTNDGSVSVTPAGGTVAADYMYQWNTTPPEVVSNITGLDVGTYTATVTDDNGCEVIDSVTVSAATILNANPVVQDITCFGDANGGIALNPTATGVENGGYTFNWSANTGAGDVDMVSDLGPGIYDVTIADAANCNIQESFTILEPDAIAITLDNVTNESCTVGNDGSATVTVLGGTINMGSDYQYTWNTTPTQSTATASGLSGGMYTISVTDDNACVDSLQVTVGAPTPPTVTVSDDTLDCADDTDGTLTADAMSGDPMVTIVTYNWDNGDNGSTISNLAPGEYIVTVTASDGCIAVDTGLVISPAPVSLDSFSFNIPTCPGDMNGGITVFMSGGTMPYTYTWSTGAMGSNPLLPGLSGDSLYMVTVTDVNGCAPFDTSLYLPNPPSINVVYTDTVAVSCNNGPNCDGQATVLASGGTNPTGLYNFTWDSTGEMEMGVTSSTSTLLCQGWQQVTVTDGNCGIIDSVFISAPPPLAVAVDDITVSEPTCFGLSDGSAAVEASGGTPPYSYLWQDGTAGNTLAGIPAGSFAVAITDDNGCPYVFTVPVEEPDSLIASIDPDQTFAPSCNGDMDGQVAVVWTGGNPGPATYTWSDNVANTSTATNLPAGTYTVTVTDMNNCSDTTLFTLTEPNPIVAIIPPIEQPQCFGFQTAILLDTVFGGNGPLFTFSVDNGPRQLVEAAIPVFAGDHTITIFDGNDCFIDTTINITQPPEVIVDLGDDVEIQLGDSIQLDVSLNSILPIDSIIWTPPTALSCVDCLEPTASPLETEQYTLTVWDTNDCPGTDDIIVDVDKNRNVFVPNIFSPNGDGWNDVFKVFTGVGVDRINYFMVFDRWGEKLYENGTFVPDPNGSEGWDGRYRGKVMDSGVYVYLIEVVFVDGTILLYRGDVTLLH